MATAKAYSYYMELPQNVRDLYRHWNGHTTSSVGEGARSSRDFVDRELLRDIEWFIRERIHIWERKTLGDSPPYTDDEILSSYRFCNIFREFDRQTIEFHTLLNPIRDDFPLWLLNMFYCRMVARPLTVEYTGLLSYDPERNASFYDALMMSPRPRFGTPYVFPISTIMRSSTPTREQFIAHYLPSIMQNVATEIQSWDKASVYDGVQWIVSLFKYNLHFLWTEVLIDVAYQYPQHIDLFARFPIGPGSAPTMRRLNPNVDPILLVVQLSQLPLDTDITYNGQLLRLSAENWEGVGCEYRKYTNLKQGKGRRRLYK